MPTTKRTLANTNAHELPTPSVSALDIRELRDSLNLSRALFARRLRVSPRTLEGWEAGRATPPPTAALLLALVARYPDTVARLARV